MRLNATYKDGGSGREIIPKFWIPFLSYYIGPELLVYGLLLMKVNGTPVLDIISKIFKYLQLKTFLIHIRTFR